MRLALEVFAIWCVGSVPLALVVGRFLRLRSDNESTGPLTTDADVRYWSVADLGGDVEEISLVNLQTGDVRAMQPTQRELSSV